MGYIEDQVAVMIPYYHAKLTETEQISFDQCLNVLHAYPIVLVLPDIMSEDDYPKAQKLEIIKVPSKWLRDISTYNRMMLTVEFYSLFLKYKYILVYQLDAFVFRDDLARFCELDYDYIGAPWLPGVQYYIDKNNHTWHVGNGGFSLRNVSRSISMLKKRSPDLLDIPEDVYWSTCETEGFSVAPKEIAVQFSMEQEAEKMFEINQRQLPFGCHAWNKLNCSFWKPIIEREGYILSEKVIHDTVIECESAGSDIWMMPCQFVKEAFMQKGLEEKKIYVWGASEIGEKCVMALQFAGLSVKCIDSDSKRWGDFFWDVYIESPDILEAESENVIILVVVRKRKNEIVDRLSHMRNYHRMEIVFYEELFAGILKLYTNAIKER